jgi:ATP-binding cassette subfamily F protein uup
VFEENGRIQEYVGGYSDWVRQGKQLAVTDNPYEAEERKRRAAERRRQRPATKLSYKDQRELDTLPAEIEELETAIAEMQQAVADPDFFAQDGDAVRETLQQLADTEAELERRVERWGELETLAGSFRSS